LDVNSGYRSPLPRKSCGHHAIWHETETLEVSRFSRLQSTARFPATSTIQNLFEILIFFSRDSNNSSALLPLRADTVFRAVQVKRMAAQNHHLSICKSVQKICGTRGSREGQIGTGALAVSDLSLPWHNALAGCR
jgi:hypothetical protein